MVISMMAPHRGGRIYQTLKEEDEKSDKEKRRNMVMVEIQQEDGRIETRFTDKFELKNDLIYLFDDRHKDKELAPMPEFVLTEVFKFTWLKITEIEEDDDKEPQESGD